MKTTLLALISCLIIFSMIVIGMPFLWQYIGIKPDNFLHFAFGSILLACLLALLFVHFKIKELKA